MMLKSRLTWVLLFFGITITSSIIAVIDQLSIEQLNKADEKLLLATHQSLHSQVAGVINNTKQNILLITSRTQLRELIQQFHLKNEQDPTQNKRKILKILRDAKNVHPWIKSITIHDAQGHYLLSSLSTKNSHTREPLNAAELTTDDIALSIKPTLNANYITRFTAKLLIDDTVIGFLKLEISLSPLNDLLVKNELLNDSFNAQILLPTAQGAFQTVFGVDHSAIFDIANKELTSKKPHIALKGNTKNDIPIKYIISPVDGTNWTLALIQTETNYLLNKQHLRPYYLYIILIMSVVSGLVGLVIAHYIVNPIKHITESAQAIIKGNLRARPHVNKGTELGDLSYAINKLADLLIATNLSLEQKVNAKTLALKSISQEAIVDNQRKSEFLSNMSHEIRTAMNGVMGMVNLLSNTPLTQAQLELIKNLLLSGENLLIIVNDILDYSKIQQNTIELVEKPAELKALADNIYNTYIPLANNKGLVINVVIKPDVPKILICDKTRLNQVISNLLGNAIKFTDTGSVNLTIALLSKEEEHCTISIHIKDTGIGIPESFLPKLFTPFAQETVTNQKHILGTGLGLAISKQLVELMQGKIWVESQMHEGTTFKIELTLGYAENFELQTSKINYDFSQFKQAKILLVEDNEINQQVALASLGQLGLSADLACNGLEALKSIKSTQYDLILMDIQMPLMDGITATKEIRKSSTLSKQPTIIALSASVLQNESNKYKQAGMQDVLAKPINMDSLKEKLYKWLNLSL